MVTEDLQQTRKCAGDVQDSALGVVQAGSGAGNRLDEVKLLIGFDLMDDPARGDRMLFSKCPRYLWRR